MKTCYYTGKNGKYTWVGRAHDSCIMAKAFSRIVTGDTLEQMEKDNVITDGELFAIRCLDIRSGDKNNISTLRKLAKRVKVKLLHE